ENAMDLNYFFHLDRDCFLEKCLIFQKYLLFVTLLSIRPMIFYILISKKSSMASDIRWGYFANQMAVFLHEFTFCYLFRMYSMAPYAALYCDGPICRKGLSHGVLMSVLSMSTISTIPTFFFILIRMHQRIIAKSRNILKNNRIEVFLIITLNVILILNVILFVSYSENCDESDNIARTSDLKWLVERGGTLFLFGPPRHAQHLRKEK
ncbi:hypothetical protein PENTCL1PPCAC_16929, partial [Pristionchus entomophagus]